MISHSQLLFIFYFSSSASGENDYFICSISHRNIIVRIETRFRAEKYSWRMTDSRKIWQRYNYYCIIPHAYNWSVLSSLRVEVRDYNICIKHITCWCRERARLSPERTGRFPKGGEGAAGASPWLLADTRRGRGRRPAFISSTSSRAPDTRSVGLAGRPAVCSNDEGEQRRAVDVGRGGSVGLVGETGIDSILCMVRGERPPPSPVLCPLPPPPPLFVKSLAQPTHSGSPGQSSRPPAHCCFFEMGLSRLCRVRSIDACPFFQHMRTPRSREITWINSCINWSPCAI